MFRHLDVAMDGALPNGLILKLVASADAGYGNGRLGVPTGEITLSGNQQEIITSIGSCYTGNGAGKGHKLTYNLASGGEDSYQNIPAGEVIVKIVFTLSDEG